MRCKRKKRTKKEEDCTMLEYNIGPYCRLGGTSRKAGVDICLGANLPYIYGPSGCPRACTKA